MAPLLQQFILGMIQGIFEWIPISSEGILILVQSNFFNNLNIDSMLKIALLLHLGTFFAALIYFRKDVKELLIALKNYKHSTIETKKLLNFLIISTIISGIIGFAIYKFVLNTAKNFILSSKIITITIGIFLLITGYLLLTSSKKRMYDNNRTIYHLNIVDSLLLGFVQGIAVLPGLSRSGLTVSSLLLRNVDDKTSLRLSFLMSLPIVLAANIFLNFKDLILIKEFYIALFFSFIFGLATIHLLMKFAEKVKFGWFVILMALIMILAGFI